MNARDDNTGSIARYALEEATGAIVETSSLAKSFHRTKWVWGVLAFLVVVAGSGFAIRDRFEHFATKEQIAAHDEEIKQLREWQKAVDAHEQARDETMKRMADQVDDIHRYFMRGRH